MHNSQNLAEIGNLPPGYKRTKSRAKKTMVGHPYLFSICFIRFGSKSHFNEKCVCIHSQLFSMKGLYEKYHLQLYLKFL